jgi:hypothetical protein
MASNNVVLLDNTVRTAASTGSFVVLKSFDLPANALSGAELEFLAYARALSTSTGATFRLRLTDTSGGSSSVSFTSAGDVGKLDARISQDSQSGRLNVFATGYCCQPTQWVATQVSGSQIVQVSWEIQVSGTASWQSDFVYAEWVQAL